MGSLNPEWLSIELDSIDATVENWTAALWSSYQSTLQSLAAEDIARAHARLNNDLDDLASEFGR
jgi:hypothetical protein